MSKKIFQKKIIIPILLLLVLAGYFGYTKFLKKSEITRYVLAQAQKGTLIVSVSGSGQVTVLDQVDIKPEVSGALVALYINKDQEVKAGQVLAEIDTKNAKQAVYDAEVALEEAKEKLEDLVSQPDAQSLRQAEVALAQAERDLNEAKETCENIEKALDDAECQAEVALTQAERDLNEAKENYENIEIDIENSLATAYEDGYNTVSAVFLKLSNYMEDLKDVLGTEGSELDRINSYELILGRNSSFIQRLIDDYYQARDSFNKNHAFFITVFQDDNRETIYQLISDTLETSQAISRTLDSARHMYDAAVLNENYKRLNIASQIDKMKPKIESDASAVSSNISSLQRIKDTIDETIESAPEKIEDAEWALQSAQEKFDEKKLALEDGIKKRPEKIEDAEWALQSAQEKFDEKKLALEELRQGADPKDIRSQENTVAQKEEALLDAKEKLAGCSIRAPFNGVVAEVNDKIKKGDGVTSNTVLATLITKQKIAKLTLNEIDTAKVKANQKVTLTFDALPDISITGKVLEVDTVGQVSQGVVSYGMKIAFDTEIEQVKPGMSVTADIITQAKADVLVLPSSAVKFQGDAYYVELVEAPEEMRQQLLASASGTILPSSPKIQQVAIGLSNDLSTEIVSGLKEGDIVVTSAISPTVAQTTQTRTTQTQGFQQGFQIPGMGGQQIKQMRDFR